MPSQIKNKLYIGKNKLYTFLDWVWLCLPLLCIFCISKGCPMGETSGENVKFRPPAYIFLMSRGL